MIKDAQRKSANAAKPKKKTSKTDELTFIQISKTGAGYHILYGHQWISFSPGEITAMAKIAGGEGTNLEIRGRFYTWLARERSDILVTASIADKFDDKLNVLIKLLKKNIKLKK